MNWIDWTVIGVILVFAVIGLFKGIIMSVYKIAAFFGCIFLSVKISPVISEALQKTPIFGIVKNTVAKNLLTLSRQATSSAGAATTGIAGANSVLGSLAVPEFFKEAVLEKLPSPSELINLDTITGAIGGEIAAIAISIFSLVIVYIVLKLIAYVLGLLLENVAELPVIKQVDRLGGLVLGAVQGFFVTYILFALLVLFNTNPKFAVFFETLQGSLFAGNLYDGNFIIKWLFRA